MSYNPYGGRYTYGGSLKHYRTKGSRNGYSNDPSYKPVGQKAVGKIINGKYVYDIPSKPVTIARATNVRKPLKKQPTQKQNWFQKGVTNVGNWLGDRGRDVSKAADNVGKSVGKAAKDAGESVGKAAKDAGNWLGDRGRDVSKAAEDFVNGLVNKKEPDKQNITDKQETKKQKRIKVDPKDFAKFIVDRNKDVDKSHISVDNKPDGVSDEYWREYIFNGGTRESWDEANKARNKSPKSSSKNSSQSEYEREEEFNNRKNNYYGLGDVENKPNFDHFTYDEKTGKTIWVDKNGKKHYK